MSECFVSGESGGGTNLAMGIIASQSGRTSVTVSGLSFIPKRVMVCRTIGSAQYSEVMAVMGEKTTAGTGNSTKAIFVYRDTNNQGEAYDLPAKFTMNSDGFTFSHPKSGVYVNAGFTWMATDTLS